MSIEAISWASKQQLPPRDKFVLVALCDHYNRDEQCAWMRQETLVKWTGYSRATVNAALDALENEHGLIRSETRRYADGRNATKIYRIVGNLSPTNEDAQAAPADSVKEFDTAPNSVNRFDTDSVKGIDTDSVKSVDSKNHEHRTVNRQPLTTPYSPPQKLAASELTRSPKGDERINYDHFKEAWNENCGSLPSITTLNQWRKDKIRQLHKQHEPHEVLEMFRAAVRAVAADDFWTTRQYGLDNLLTGNKILARAEQWQNTRGLTEGNRKLATTAARIARAIEGMTQND